MIPSLIDAHLAGVVIKLPARLPRKLLRKLDEPGNFKKRVSGKMVSEFKRALVELLRELMLARVKETNRDCS